MVSKVFTLRADVVERQRGVINSIRMDLEARPVALAEGAFQCDERALTRIRLTMECWGATSHTRTEDGRQMWPDVGNQIHTFTEAEFADFLVRLRTAVAARADRLYALANDYKAQLPLADDHPIFDRGSSTWQSVM